MLLVEGFVRPTEFRPGFLSALLVDDEDVKLCRMTQSRRVGPLAVLDFHYLVATPASGIERLFERHEVGLFGDDEYRRAFEEAGLTFAPATIPEIAFGRPVYTGISS